MEVNCKVKFVMEHVPVWKKAYMKEWYTKENTMAVDVFNERIGDLNKEFHEVYGSDVDLTDENSLAFHSYCRFIAIHVNPYLKQLNTKLKWWVDQDNMCAMTASLPNYPKSKCYILIKQMDL